ncbi:MAG: acyl-CoA dehydrogenase [Halieaceae bacterium]|nr:MAG: acyl-CoA dehydrogenase [Halieaceae bacterium]
MEEQYGGAGTSPHVTLAMIEELSEMGFGASHPAMVFTTTSSHPTSAVTAPRAESLLVARMAKGEVVGALAMTEPGAGSDVQGIRTNAVRDGDEWVLNGSKIFITNGIHADLVIVAAITDAGKGAKGTSLFLVDAHSAGFEKSKKIDKIGQHTSDTALLFFNDVRLPATALLGEENRGFVIMMEELRENDSASPLRRSLPLKALWISRCNMFRSAKLSDRKSGNFRIPASNWQTLKRISPSIGRSTSSAREYANGTLTADTAAMLKLASCEMQCRVADQCLQLFGGYGYTAEYPISRFYVDARIQTIYGGSSEIMRELVARSMLGR